MAQALADGTMSPEVAAVSYNYTWPLVMLACLGVAALILGLILKVIDRRKGLGLEEPNVKEPQAEILASEVSAAEE